LKKKEIAEGKLKRLSLVVPAKTYDVILALAQIYGFSLNDVAGNVLNQFAAKNAASVEELEQAKKTAQKKISAQGELDFGQLDCTKKAAE